MKTGTKEKKLRFCQLDLDPCEIVSAMPLRIFRLFAFDSSRKKILLFSLLAWQNLTKISAKVCCWWCYCFMTSVENGYACVRCECEEEKKSFSQQQHQKTATAAATVSEGWWWKIHMSQFSLPSTAERVESIKKSVRVKYKSCLRMLSWTVNYFYREHDSRSFFFLFRQNK